MQRRTLANTKIIVRETTQTVVGQPGTTPKIVSTHKMAPRRC